MGADPTTHKATVLQTAEFADSLYLLILVGEEGLEPSMFLMSRFYGQLPSPLGDSPELTKKIPPDPKAGRYMLKLIIKQYQHSRIANRALFF